MRESAELTSDGAFGLLSTSYHGGILVSHKASHTRPVPEQYHETTEWEPWGADNNLPNDLKRDMKPVGVLRRGINNRAHLHLGSNLLPYTLEVDGEKGDKLVKKLAFSPEVKGFMRRNRMLRQQKKLVHQLEVYAIAFVEMVLTHDYSRVYSYRVFEENQVRLGRINPNTGRREHVFISGDFPYPRDLKKVVKVPLLDEHEPLQHLMSAKSHKYVMALKYLDANGYPDPIWNSLRESQWLEVAVSIPRIKKAIFDNQMTLKHHIEISEIMLEQRYNWSQIKKEDKTRVWEEILDEIDERLKGVDKAGKSIMSAFGYNHDGKEMIGLKITPVKNEFSDGLYNIDSATANSEILYAAGVHGSWLGHGVPGGKENSGSGSDIRESMLAFRAQVPSERLISTEHLDVIGQYNEYDVDHWGYVDLDTSQTLDKNPTGSKTALN